MFGKWVARSAVALLLAGPAVAFAGPAGEPGAQSQLSAFIAYADLRVHEVQRALELLSSTGEVRSGRWETMRGLVSGYQQGDGGLVAWYALADGRYYTGDQGLMEQTLRDRDYFADLQAGREVAGALVVSKSTGQRSAVIAVPVKRDGQVVGAVGASLFLDRFAAQVDSSLALGPDQGFWAMAPDGRTTLHRKADRHFLDPRTMGSETLKRAADEMLSRAAGEVTYEFDNVTRKAVYRRSGLTNWTFVITTNAR